MMVQPKDERLFCEKCGAHGVLYADGSGCYVGARCEPPDHMAGCSTRTYKTQLEAIRAWARLTNADES